MTSHKRDETCILYNKIKYKKISTSISTTSETVSFYAGQLPCEFANTKVNNLP